MNLKLSVLPDKDQVRIGLCSFDLQDDGCLLVEIQHTLVVHDLAIFFGRVDGKTLHGYCDFERSCGGISFDE